MTGLTWEQLSAHVDREGEAYRAERERIEAELAAHESAGMPTPCCCRIHGGACCPTHQAQPMPAAEFRARLALHVLATTEDTRDAAAALRPIPAVCQHPGRAGAICFACNAEARR